MKKKLLLKTCFVMALTVLSANQTFGQMVLTQETANDYLEIIVGQGIEWSNAYISGSTDAIASFTDGESGGLPPNVENGIVLSTGSVATSNAMAGPASIFSSTDMGTPGFSELNALSGLQTYDGIALGFDIVPTTNKLKINFQFGSEEYPEFVNTDYNDVIGIFITGPGISSPYPGINIALAPNGPRVCTNTFNKGNGCPPTNINATNPFYFIDNCSGIYDNVMDGFTIMLVAEADVIPCETYHIRLMIADVIDSDYDSWLIIPEKGFYADGLLLDAQVNYANGGATAIEGCSGSQLLFCLDEPLEVDYVVDIVSVTGTATEFYDYLPFLPSYTIPAGETCVAIDIVTLLDDQEEGIETIVIEYQKNICNTDEIIIEMQDKMENCCYPDEVFEAPTGEPQQTLVQGQTLADLVVNGEPGAEFVWYADADLAVHLPSTTEAIDQTTYYVIQVIDGCESDALSIFVETTLSNIIFDEKSFRAYPNPVTDIFTISYNKEITNVEVTNMLGQILISTTENSTDVQIDMSGLAKGNYLVKVKTDEMIKIVKVVKQ